MAYTPALIVSRAVTENLPKASWIRRMFEEGARLKQERGADKVFDFTLGNPEIEPPPAVLAAARRVLEALLERAARPIVLISDEPYRALVFDDVIPPEIPPLVTRSIVATSWSKSLAIPGERLGYLAFSPRLPRRPSSSRPAPSPAGSSAS